MIFTIIYYLNLGIYDCRHYYLTNVMSKDKLSSALNNKRFFNAY